MIFEYLVGACLPLHHLLASYAPAPMHLSLKYDFLEITLLYKSGRPLEVEQFLSFCKQSLSPINLIWLPQVIPMTIFRLSDPLDHL